MTSTAIETQETGKNMEQVIEIDTPCATTMELVKSEKFGQFFRIMNAKRGKGRGSEFPPPDTYALTPANLQFKHDREKAREFWKSLTVRGRVKDIEETNALVEKLNEQMEEFEKLKQEQLSLIELYEAL